MKKEGNKKKILIIAGVALALLIIAAILLFVVFAPKFSEQDILKDPSGAMTFCSKSIGQTGCYVKISEVLALNNTDMATRACLSISTAKDDGDMKNCIEELAGKQTEQLKAVEVCNALKNDTKFRENCYGRIMANFPTLDTGAQLAMCDAKTGTDKDNCYRGLSENFLLSNVSKSIEICNRISEKSTKDSCLNSIIGNPEIVQANPSLSVSICDSLTLKANCYNYVAQTVSGTDTKQGALICQKLSDDNQILNCYHGAWFGFNSIVLQNYDFTISLCNILTIKRDDCLRGASEAFMTTDKTKAAAICRLASASASEGCLHVVQNGY
jgi:hypothetical protein